MLVELKRFFVALGVMLEGIRLEIYYCFDSVAFGGVLRSANGLGVYWPGCRHGCHCDRDSVDWRSAARNRRIPLVPDQAASTEKQEAESGIPEGSQLTGAA